MTKKQTNANQVYFCSLPVCIIQAKKSRLHRARYPPRPNRASKNSSISNTCPHFPSRGYHGGDGAKPSEKVMGGAAATKLDGKTTRYPRGKNTKRNQPTRWTGARRSRYRQPHHNVTPGDFFEIPTLGRPVLFLRHDARQSLRRKKQLSETLVVGHALPGPTNHRLGTSSTPESAVARSPAAAFPTTAHHGTRPAATK